MQRWVLSAAICALLTLPVWGQRGGGGHGGGGGGFHGSGGGFHGGGMAMGGGHSFAGGSYTARAPASYGYRGAYARPGYTAYPRANWNNGYRGWNNGWRGNGWWWNGNRWIWRSGWWGYPWWGWSGWGWNWWPGWGWGGSSWDEGSYYPSDYYSPYQAQSYPSYVSVNPEDSGYTEDSQTQDEIGRLQGEVDQLRAQQQAQTQQGKMIEIHSETVLVYRDGHKEEVQNYAIAGKTLWIFNETHAKKVPLSELDLSATRRDNADRGIEFTVPESH